MSLAQNTYCDEICGWSKENQIIFVQKYWQRQPLMIRNAFEEEHLDIPTKRELLDLSVDDDVESRLLQLDASAKWTKSNGPFERSFLSSLKKEDVWTILVQEVDRHVPAVADLWRHFDLIPGWRRDDVMISYATAGGGIGAHVDNYDVFLIQGRGEREWSIENAFLSSSDELTREVKGAQTRLLRDFRADQSWRLSPGDMLYLPPRVPHRGVSCGMDCTTVSMGFRAPSYRSLMVAFSAHLCSTSIDENHYYSDPDMWRHASSNDGAVSSEASEGIAAALRGQFQRGLSDPKVFDRWLGRYLTEPLRMHIRPPRAFFLEEKETVHKGSDFDGDTGGEEEEDEEEEQEFQWSDDYDDETYDDDELPLAASSRHSIASSNTYPDAEAVVLAALTLSALPSGKGKDPASSSSTPAPAPLVDLRLFEGVRRVYMPSIRTLFLSGEAFPVAPAAEKVAALLGGCPSRTLPSHSLHTAFQEAGALDDLGKVKQSAALRFLCGLIRSGYYYPVDRVEVEEEGGRG